MPRKLIIDADPGIGDALAITLAVLDPDIDLLAVTATAGCVDGPTATRNVTAILTLLDPDKRPKVGACEAGDAGVGPEFGGEELDWAAVNGPDGLGAWQLPDVELYAPRDSPRLLVELVREHEGEVTLLTLGPLTNVKLAAERWGGFYEALGGLVIGAGSVEIGGDATAAAEFNVAADPLAARSVLTGRSSKTLVPLDVTRRPVLSPSAHETLKGAVRGGAGELLSQMLPWALRSNHQHFGVEGISLQEPTALAAAVRPELFEREEMAVDVETAGDLTYGMTVFDRRGVRRWQTNTEVVREVDAAGVQDYVLSVLAGDDLADNGAGAGGTR
ncbi:nucleoside hydrolase [Alienimonas chondri]|uniref:Pyrimidine-specific ribonucleoside hydrolase RihA n=1 Tax=Alienimonas chondri TaxID=2681879 RepID=A0ABX1V941_9PLAN|nr:nucleoside hydrolase [Alienimonas chondri]NNJ24065.1 Pyrimidine-specific ribonucleoside hydrolase RihA [Alienimonas chondri]